MRKIYSLLIIISIAFLSFGWHSDESSKKDKAEITKRVKALLDEMTLEEKIGQMTEVTLQVVSAKQGTKDQKHELDEEKLKEAVLKYKVGSILNVYDAAHDVDYWHSIITKIQDLATKQTRMKIPVIYGIDAIHGATYTRGSTLFPQALGMASTWNSDLAKREGAITALEVKASGIPWNYYPVMDIGRQPLWPRLWETYGEDVYLAVTMGRNYIEGAQGDDISSPDKVATCLKHYVGYSYPMNGRDRTPAWISERMLREYFLPTFEAGIKAGAPTVMVNSSEVDGIPVHSDYHLLTEVLRGELKFKGFTVSDWEDIKRLYTRDRVADSPKEAVRMAVMAGIDMSMVPLDYSFYNYLLELVNENKVPMSRIDEAVGRILEVKMELGLFDNPYPDKSLIGKIATKEASETNLQAARESLVMTKNNNNFLPLKKGTKVLVTGPTANLLSVLNGGWTITWQGNEESLYPQDNETILEAIQSKNGKENTVYVEGTDFNSEVNVKAAIDKANESDVIILCLGEPAYCESPGNIDNLKLNETQLDFALRLAETRKPVVLLMIEGRPRLIGNIEPKINSILVGFLPGMEGGRAVADILFGDANPSGKLPVTYPKAPNGNTTYDYKPLEHFDQNNYDPQWPFGFGLSYTTFGYSNLKIDKQIIKDGENVNASVDVMNSGKVEGKEVVQLYLCDEYGSVSRPDRQIKGFDKVSLKPGEKKTIAFTITPDELSFIGRDNKRIIEPGKFKVMISNMSAEFELK